MAWSIFNKGTNESNEVSQMIANVWWLRHEPHCGKLVVFNATEGALGDVEIKLCNEAENCWSIHLGNIDYGVAREVPFADLLLQSGNAFQGTLTEVTVRSFDNFQHFKAKGNRFMSNHSEEE